MKVLNFDKTEIQLELSNRELFLLSFLLEAGISYFNVIRDQMGDFTEEELELLSDQFSDSNHEFVNKLLDEDNI